MNKPNIISSIIGFAISTYVFITANNFPLASSNDIGPGYFPILISIGLMILSLSLLIQTLFNKGKQDYEKLDIRSPELIRSFLSLVGTIVYGILMQFIGFIVSTIIYLIYLMYLLRNRNYKQMIFVSIVASIAVYIVFKGILKLTLPTGILI